MRGDLRALPPAAWVLFAGTFVNRCGSFVPVCRALYLARRGCSPGQAGLAVTAYGAGGLAAGIAGVVSSVLLARS